jgi:hypothetical protein
VIQKKEKEIDGHSYLVHQFPARQGLAIKISLIKLVGPAIASLVDNKEGISSETMQRAVSELTSKLDSSTVPLLFSLLQFTRRDGKEITEQSFDQDFAGEYESLYKVVWFVIETNAFFGKGGIGNALRKFQPTPAQPVSPPASPEA